ncbi:MAG: hypothetical protein KC543_05115 [Myxococcales bacterium]|nr:hypothetical protein [Myxococcales bacterium]
MPPTVVYAALAMLLAGAFFALDETTSGLTITFHPPWDRFSPGELNGWIGAIFLLAPAGIFAGLAVAPWLWPALERLHARLATTRPARWALALVGLFVVAVALAALCNAHFFGGFPFTDDEWAARFGGQVLALGKLAAPIPPARNLFTDLFLFQRAGHWTSFDYLGALLPWAVSELTRSGGLVFHLFYGASVVALAVAAGRRFGRTWGLVAALIGLASPEMLVLGSSTHSQLVSRAWLAIGFAPLIWNDRLTRRAAALSGLGIGMGLITRPPEVLLLALPCLLVLLARALKDRSLRNPVLVGLVVILAIQAVAFIYRFELTGSLLPVRFAHNDVVHPYANVFRSPFDPAAMARRFGDNFAYNLLTLSVWFLGPLGALLALLGATRDAWTKAMAIGVVLNLGLALLHDDRGLHCVGAIHYSEATVPLALLVVAGLHRLSRSATDLGVARAPFACAFVGYCVVSMGLFTAWSGGGLAQQAKIHTTLYGAVDEYVPPHSVLLAPQYAAAWQAIPEFRATGSWVFEWRRARPDLSDEVIIVRDGPGAAAEARAAFPARKLWRLGGKPGGGLLFVPIPDAER